MWIMFACLSALFAGLTSILAKIGIKNTDSNLATAIRTGVVLLFSWAMVFIVGSQTQLGDITLRSLLFLILSGLATGASWLCYFRALQIGDINKVVPVDKSSTVLTILLAFFILGETPTVWGGIGVVLIAVGTLLMITKKKTEENGQTSKKWLFYAVLSAVFAALTSIFAKIGIENVESNLGTAVRTIVVLAMSLIVVAVTKHSQSKQGKALVKPTGKELLFIILSGFATGASWLCYYRALQDGKASVVVPIDKLSILVTVLFSLVVFKEKLSGKAWAGLGCLVAGTMLMIIK